MGIQGTGTFMENKAYDSALAQSASNWAIQSDFTKID